MSSAIKSIDNKWLDKKEIVTGLLREHGRFYDYITSKGTSQSDNFASTSDDGYAPQMVSYQQLLKQSKPDEAFDLVQALDAFRPASIDP